MSAPSTASDASRRREPPLIGITSTPLGVGAARHVSVNDAYVRAVAGAGGLPVVLPVLPPRLVDAVIRRLDGLLLSGGGDVDPACYGQEPGDEVGGVDRARDDWELELVRAALSAAVPVLAICRGLQVLNVARGGTLVQHLADVTDQLHLDEERRDQPVFPVRLDPGSLVADLLGSDRLPGGVATNSLHHQGVDRLGLDLCATAWADDGTIEAVEPTDRSVAVGVQWHPELLAGHPPHERLFEWLVDQTSVGRGGTDVEERGMTRA